MTGLVTDFRLRVRLAVRAAALSVVGIVFCATGFAFLTAALWVLVATYQGALAAWMVLGFIYILLGMCFVLIGTRPDPALRRRSVAPTPPPPAQGIEPFLRMAEAFAVGLQAGRSARRPKR
jgi:hypothetical protein